MEGGVRKRGNSWYYYFDLAKVDGERNKHERKAVGATTKGEALTILRKAMTEYENSGTLFEPSNVSVSDYLDFWLEEYVKLNLSHNTWDNYKGVIKNHIKPVFGNMRLRSISPEVLQKFINDKFRDEFSRQTLTIFHSVLNNSLKQAVYPYKLIKENPMQYVRLPREERKKRVTKADKKILTLKELKTIMEYIDENNTFYIPMHLGFNTGMRVSEVCGLKWDMVDLHEGTIEVDKAMVYKEKEWVLGPPKSNAAYRKFKIGDTLINILESHKFQQKKNKLKYGEHYHKSDFVCTKENGEPTTPSSVKWSCSNIKSKLGIDINFHSFRHTHATLLMEHGADIKDIQKKLGHARSSITIDTYSHLTENMQNKTVDIFEGITNELK